MSNSVPHMPLLPVGMNISTPRELWVEQKGFPPDGTRTRYSRLELYRSMYDGDFSYFQLNDLEIPVNYFAQIADFWADMLLSFPPELSDDSLEVFQSDLNTALYDAIRDYWVYGVGILYPYEKDGEMRVEAVDPRLWYPLSSGEGDVVIRFFENKYIDIGFLPIDNTPVVVRRHEINGYTPTNSLNYYAGSQVTPFRCTIGRFIEEFKYPSMTGRGVQPVAHLPAQGDWGTSIYPKMAAQVFEISKRFSDVSAILTEHAFPLLTESGEPSEPDPDAPFSSDQQTTEGEDSDQSSKKLRYDRRQGIKMKVPAGVKLEYVTWDPQMKAQFEQIDRTQASVFIMTSTPTTIFGLQSANTQPRESGEALRRTFIPTYLKCRQIQTAFTAAIEGSLKALDKDAEINWPEPLESIDLATRPEARAEGMGEENVTSQESGEEEE